MTVGICVAATLGFRLALARTRATAREARALLAGDDIVPDPTTVWNRGISIKASPSHVWPWLVQMGYGRAGFYVPEWVDHMLWRVPATNSSVPATNQLHQ